MYTFLKKLKKHNAIKIRIGILQFKHLHPCQIGTLGIISKHRVVGSPASQTWFPESEVYILQTCTKLCDQELVGSHFPLLNTTLFYKLNMLGTVYVGAS